MTNSQYRWVIVAAGCLLGCVAIGAMFSLPVFLGAITRDTGWSVTGVSSAMTIGFLALALTSMAWATCRSLRPRFVVATGSITLAISLALASQTTSLIAFQLIFGLLVGASIAAIFPPMMVCVTGWFDMHRSLAVSLVSAGMGMAPMTMSPLAAWLVSIYDWRTSMLIIAAVAAAVMIPVSLRRARPPPLQSGGGVAAAGGEDSSDVRRTGIEVASVLHPAPDELLLLCHALRPDHSHGELRCQLRYLVDRCRFNLQRGGVRWPGWARRLRLARRPVRGEAVLVLALLAQALGALGTPAASDLGDVPRGRSRVRLHLCWHYTAVCVIARETFRCG